MDVLKLMTQMRRWRFLEAQRLDRLEKNRRSRRSRWFRFVATRKNAAKITSVTRFTRTLMRAKILRKFAVTPVNEHDSPHLKTCCRLRGNSPGRKPSKIGFHPANLRAKDAQSHTDGPEKNAHFEALRELIVENFQIKRSKIRNYRTAFQIKFQTGADRQVFGIALNDKFLGEKYENCKVNGRIVGSLHHRNRGECFVFPVVERSSAGSSGISGDIPGEIRFSGGQCDN